MKQQEAAVANTQDWVKLLIIGVALAVLVGMCAVVSNQPPAGLPEVHADIRSMTDCSELQFKFDTAYENHQRDIRRGRTDLARMSTAYMETADDRMREVGCYD